MRSTVDSFSKYFTDRVEHITILIFAFFLLCPAIVASNPDHAGQEDSSYRIVAYAGGDMEYWKMDAAKLTHINYAFAHVNDEGEIFFGDEAQAAQQLAKLQALKAKNPDLKLLVSVGGWGADGFSDAAYTEKSREVFSKSAVEMIKRYGLDGIDIDWEYPGQPGPGIKYRKEDKETFTLMLKSLREHLDTLSDERGRKGEDRYLLTIASNDDQSYFDHTNMGEVYPYLDFINVMSYDMYTVGSETTGHHAGLYQPESRDSSRTAESAVRRHLDAGIPPQKIVMGAAMYGRGWTDVNSENSGLLQPFGKWYGFIQYRELQEKYINKNGFKRHWDATAKAPFLWNPESQTFISYEDGESLKHKAVFVREMGLGGIMYWHHAYDPSGELLDALYNGLKE